jgi:two-component system, OmpR family, catabolic regulation response regulator CreB
LAQILIIEDEPSIAQTLVFALNAEGFQTHWVNLGRAGLGYLQQSPVDLVILDVGLPDESGFDVCKKIRKCSEVPVIFLTARGQEIDRVVGLELGADDYVVKPFSPREVAARVKAILKRTQSRLADELPRPAAVAEGLSYGPFLLLPHSRSTLYCQAPLSLTRMEFDLLQLLLKNPQQVWRREQLLQALHIALDAGYERNIDTHIKALRAKCKKINPTLDPIKTHRGLGYSLQ